MIGSRPGHAEAIAAKESLSKVKLFKGCSERFLEVLAEQVRHQIIPEGVDIIKEGDHGDSMYILTRGEADVLMGGTVISTLEDGTIFGEFSALCRNRAMARRTATVRSRTLCDCRVTSRKVVMQTALNFPKDADIIQKEVDRKINQLNIHNMKDGRQWQPLRSHLEARSPRKASAHGLEARSAQSRGQASSRLSGHSPDHDCISAKQFYRAFHNQSGSQSGSPEFDLDRLQSPDSHESAAGHLSTTPHDSDALPPALVDVGDSGVHPAFHQDSARPDSKGAVHLKQATPSRQKVDPSYVTSDMLLALALPGIAFTRARQTQADHQVSTESVRECFVSRFGPENEYEVAFDLPLPKPPMSARERWRARYQDMSLPAGGSLVSITKKGAARARLAATRVSCLAAPQARQADGGGRQFNTPTVASRAASGKLWKQLVSPRPAWQREAPKAPDVPREALVSETETLWQRHQKNRARKLESA